MAIFQNCKSCGAQISAQAKTCPHCKTVLVKDEPETKPKRKRSSRNVWEGVKGLPQSGHRSPRKRITGWTVTGVMLSLWVVYAVLAPSPEAGPGVVGPDGIAGWQTVTTENRAGGGQCGTQIEAFTYTQILITRKLKNPNSAEFSLADARFKMTECGRWSVASYVDATNSFGGQIRTHFTAVVRRVSGDHWALESYEKR